MSLSEYSLASGPQPIDIVLASIEPWQLRVSVRFSNECLADAGLKVFHLDLVDQNQNGIARLIRLAQKKTPTGCPEIWQPVTRCFIIGFPEDGDFDRVMIMDWSNGGKGSDKLLQTLTLNREDVAPAIAPDFSGVFIETSPMFPGKMLPVLDNIVITPGTHRGYIRDYKISFTVRHPFKFSTRNGITAHIIETRTGVSDRKGLPVVDWLFVSVPADHKHREAQGAMDNYRHEIILQLLQTYEHLLVVVNPGFDRGKQNGRIFRVYDIQ
jgi:hypothetical protein